MIQAFLAALNQPHDRRYRPWCVRLILPGHPMQIARFPDRSTAESHARFLRRNLPAATVTIYWDGDDTMDD